MKTVFALFVAAAVAVAPAVALARDADLVTMTPAVAVHGKALYGPEGSRIGAIYRVTFNGSAQLIMDGRLVTVPVATLSDQRGRIMTTMTRKDLLIVR